MEKRDRRRRYENKKRKSTTRSSTQGRSDEVVRRRHNQNSRRAQLRRKRIRQRRIILGCMGAFLVIFFAVVFNLFINTVYKSCVVEAGYIVQASDFEKQGFGEISFIDGSEYLDTSTVGVFDIKVRKGFITHTCELTVKDTVAPTAEGIETTISMLMDLTAEECVTDATDVTTLSYDFVIPIDKDTIGVQEVVVGVTDEGGNTIEVTSVITVSDDVEAPEITAPDTISSLMGAGVSYLQDISAIDNSGEEVVLDIDNSSVDIDTEGDYIVTVTATDWLGNVSTQDVTVHIYKELTEQDKVEAMADEVLAEILDDSMTEYDICYAIFYWCRNNIAYSGHSEKGDWVAGAYDGFVYGSGDCYTYFATAKVLLTQAGITNMDIEKIPASTEHYWNLVDIGDGWVHFDTTRRSDGTIIFLWTDAELMEYSNSHNLSHNYDPDLYPDIT